MKLKFSKYQACGNDFIIVDEDLVGIIKEEDKSKIAQKLCQYHFSIGANGVLYVSQNGEFYNFRIFEPDGSESDMCGNGIRCVAAYYFKKDKKEEIVVKTNNDLLLKIKKMDNFYQVNMGSLLPINKYLNYNMPTAHYKELSEILYNDEKVRHILSSIDPKITQMHMVNIGEPHLIIFVKNIYDVDIAKIGEIAKQRAIFPHGININLVEIVSDSTIIVRSYERGNWNETLSCGTGSSSAAAITRKIFYSESNQITVITKGGSLEIKFDGSEIFLSGRAIEVFTGEKDMNTFLSGNANTK